MNNTFTINLFKKEMACSAFELQRRLCEVGRADSRYEPLELVEILEDINPQLIESSIDDFYTLEVIPKEVALLVMRLKKRQYQKLLDAIQIDCTAPGMMLREIFIQAGGSVSETAIETYENQEKWPFFKGFLRLGSVKYKMRFAIFNLRSWLYPFSWRIWQVIHDSLVEGSYPVLLSRQIARSTFMFFRATKMIGYQLYKQYLESKAFKDIGRTPSMFLGFSDLAPTESKEVRYKKFFDGILKNYLRKNFETFTKRSSMLLERANVLRDPELKGGKRLEEFKIVIGDLPESEEKAFLEKFVDEIGPIFESDSVYARSILRSL